MDGRYSVDVKLADGSGESSRVPPVLALRGAGAFASAQVQLPTSLHPLK